MKKYIIIKLFLPTLLIFVLPIIPFVIINYFGVILKSDLEWFVLSLDFRDVNNFVYQAVLYFGCVYFMWVKISKDNKDEIFMSGNIYGTRKMFIYNWGYLLGYRKIRLVYKPYESIYKILKFDKFEIIPNDRDLNEPIKVEFTIDEIEGLGKIKDTINIVVSDTYEIIYDQLPDDVKRYKTIFINRTIPDKNVRIYSKDFITKVSSIILRESNLRETINLFLTTSVSNTKEIFENSLLMANRNNVNFILYIQSMEGNKEFKEKVGLK